MVLVHHAVGMDLLLSCRVKFLTCEYHFKYKGHKLASTSVSYSVQGWQKQYGWCGICHTTLFVLMYRHTTFNLRNTCTCMVYACVQPHPL